MSDQLSVAATNLNPYTVHFLRRVFRLFNPFMLFLWRLDMAQWFMIAPRLTGQIMVVCQRGRKSGLLRRTPLNYAVVNNELYCTAGFGHVAHWYRNMMANPQIEVWLPDGRWNGIATDITERADALDLMREVLIGSGFAAFAAGINPYKLTDAELIEATYGYRLVHIQRTKAVNGAGGPGDLRWVWQVATFVLVPLILLRSRPRNDA